MNYRQKNLKGHIYRVLSLNIKMMELTITELFLNKTLEMLRVPNTCNLALLLRRGNLPELLRESHSPLSLILHRFPVAMPAQYVLEHNYRNFSPLLLPISNNRNELAS